MIKLSPAQQHVLDRMADGHVLMQYIIMGRGGGLLDTREDHVRGNTIDSLERLGLIQEQPSTSTGLSTRIMILTDAGRLRADAEAAHLWRWGIAR